MNDPRRDPSLPAELAERIRVELARETPRRSSPAVGLVIAASAFPLVIAAVLAARFAVSGHSVLRSDIAELAVDASAPKLAGALALAVTSSVVAVRPGRLGLGSRVQVLAVVAALAAPAYALTMLTRPLDAGDATHAAAAFLHPWGLPCVVVALVVASAGLALLTLALRGTVPAAARLRGAALGAAAGSWAGLVLSLHCPAYDVMHLLVGHTAPIALFTGVGAVVAQRYLRP